LAASQVRSSCRKRSSSPEYEKSMSPPVHISSADMPSAPAVSILLPAFQAAATLDACLRSIVQQTEPRWECVLVDDGSTDRPADIAREWAAREPRLRVVRTAHRGLVEALGTGLAVCRGAAIARMDADDVMHRERLAVQRAAFADVPSLAAVGCRVRLFPRARILPGLR